jgi:hypothetical protein
MLTEWKSVQKRMKSSEFAEHKAMPSDDELGFSVPVVFLGRQASEASKPAIFLHTVAS